MDRYQIAVQARDAEPDVIQKLWLDRFENFDVEKSLRWIRNWEKSDKPFATTKSVRLFGPGEEPEVLGMKKRPLNKTRYAVVLAIAKAAPIGLSKSELVKKSGCGDAVNILKGLAKADEDWQAVISLPGEGGKGRGYRIA